ncbi:trypsin-like peptidase domain-containing protein [Carboxylicivirga sediminis]|uniref:Trypsin-like peptidase domain-containing protein n=1 Tax=Carboxylicivirga sediminis TaxID=2006564 RepID=A0A941F1F7_9BACT|nr:serine protease [Carboxylicivirga sediminis]MBR8534274.1 trypsin-like peptidase domain-containing protein [Carboxylicivirga sediminis]
MLSKVEKLKQSYVLSIVLLAMGLLLLCNCNESTIKATSDHTSGEYLLEEEPINDAELIREFEIKASEYYKEHGGTESNTFKEQINNTSCKVSVKPQVNEVYNGAAFYQQFKSGVLLMGKMYKCGHCPKDHISAASAFVISDDGICVTNYHVFKSYDPSRPNNYTTFFVMDSERNVYPVTEVLAGSKKDDLAVFKIDTKGKILNALSLGNQKVTGEHVNLISHPDGRFYSYTQGDINRTYFKPGSSKIRQSISANFAAGSSGAPIMDKSGNVIGIVAGTQNITYGPNGGIYQMTINEIIPVSQLKELIK